MIPAQTPSLAWWPALFLPVPGAWLAGPRVQWDPQILIYSLIFISILLVGALVIAVVQRWRQLGSRGSCSISASDQLAQYRELYEEGEISAEEFQRLRALLGGKIRQEVEGSGDRAPAGSTTAVTATAPAPGPDPHNPSRSPDPPETGIRPG
jgi:hypothetical protein